MEWSERIGRRIMLRDLHILLAVVQCKSMARAAEQLAISKPVISKVIANLEHVLGVRLLERDRHGAEPTSYGAALLRRGITVFDELRAGVKEIEFLVDPTAGDVRIGCNPILATSFLPAVIDRLSRRFPRIVFHVVARQADTLHRELIDRNVDFLIARRLIELAELMNEVWVLPPPDNVVGSVVLKAFRARGLDYPRSTVVSDSPHVRMTLLATGRFLSIFPVSALRFPTKSAEVRELSIDLPRARVPVGIVTLRNRTLGPVARLFIEQAWEVAMPSANRT